MSSAVAVGHMIKVSMPSLSALFARTGEKLPEGKKPTVSVWPASYVVQVAAMVDRFII